MVPFAVMTNCSGQNGQSNVPSSNYKVHREYDKDGNLVQYDSTAVSSWSYNSNSGQDSLSMRWDNSPEFPFSINDSLNMEDSSFYGFNFNDQPYNMQAFPNFNDFFNDMHPSNNDFAKHIKEMEKRMDEMMRRNMQLLNQFNGNHFYYEIPKNESSDSIMQPEKPKQMKNSGKSNIINI
jgi:hypothetical protein